MMNAVSQIPPEKPAARHRHTLRACKEKLEEVDQV